MTEKERQEQIESFLTISIAYYTVFTSFVEKTGNTEQSYRLTKDMFSAIFNQNNKPDSLSIFWDK